MHLIAAAGHLLAATSTTKKSSNSSYFIFVYAALIFVVYYFFIRPRNRKTREARSQARQVEVGDRAQTIGGLVGTIISRTDTLVTIRCDSGAVLDFVPQAIARRVDPVVPESTDDDQASGAHDEAHDDGPESPEPNH